MKKTLIFLLFLPIWAVGQIEIPGTPYAFTNQINFSEISNFTLTDFNKNLLLSRDNEQKFYKPYAFAQGFDTEIFFNKKPDAENKDFYIFFKKIIIPDAEGISLIFRDFQLADKEKIFIFDNSEKYLIGALTSLNNKENSVLATRFLPVDTVIVEYDRLKTNTGKFPYISTVAGAYRTIADGSQDCEINIACEEDTLWQTVKRAVAKVIYKEDKSKSYYACTGTLLANTKLDNTPYYLTANHCINSETEAESAVFYFNYEAETCDGTTGDKTQTISGAKLLATADDHLDFALLQLSVVPPEVYHPYYAGWDRVQEYIDTSFCIHHPAGDVKKISKDYDTLGISSFSGYDSQKHWQIKEWDEGTTEGGSSGAGLFTVEGLLIGTLSGGEADCDYNFNDLFCQFYHEWDDYNPKDEQVKAWLDTFKFNPVKMFGYDPYQNINLSKPLNFNILQDSNIIEITWDAANNNPEKYMIYRNLEKIYETSTPEILYDTLRQTGVYVYYATAVFDNEESKPSNMKSVVFGDTSTTPKITEVKVFPNPAKYEIAVLTPDTIPVTKIIFFNALGQPVKIVQIDNKSDIIINIADLRSGMYFLQIFTTGEIYRKKLFIDKF